MTSTSGAFEHRSPTSDFHFAQTRWTVVLAARGENSPESGRALETLCRAYWLPLYAYVRRCGRSQADAEDLTQSFFLRLIEKDYLKSVDREKGRFRTFLLVALKRFMANEWRRASAQRRGGGQFHVPIDTKFAESRFVAAESPAGADELFDQQWALTLIDLTLQRLRAEFASAGKPNEFEVLKDCLAASRGEIAYDDVAQRLGASESAARVAVHRLRKRFREIYREEVAHTLTDGTDLEQELHYLGQTLSRT